MLYFAGGREAAGVSHETLEVPRGLTAAGMRDLLVGRHPALAGVVDTCVLAVDQQYVEGAGPLPFRDGCEVALIPPISGG